ncbi:MAG: hypothetical protein COA33_005905 [Fluviicola sp.]|nr:hypothetical protein [Fluviicola sp.]
MKNYKITFQSAKVTASSSPSKGSKVVSAKSSDEAINKIISMYSSIEILNVEKL